MIVLDAGVFVAATCSVDPDGARARAAMDGDQQWCAPEHFRLEAANAIRGLVRGCALSASSAAAVVAALSGLEVRLVPTVDLLPRIWQLRDNLSAYDAAYVALAESLDVQLVTADQRLARAPGIRCRIVHP